MNDPHERRPRQRMMQFGCLAAAIAAAIGVFPSRAGAQTPKCHVPSFTFCPNCAVPVHIKAEKDAVCRISYRASGGLTRQQVIKRPRGIYGTANETAGAYKPPPGFVGQDYFEVLISYQQSNGTKVQTTLQITVEIGR